MKSRAGGWSFRRKWPESSSGQISAQLQEHGLGGITEIDLRNQYDITMTYDDRIVFRFGNTNDMEYKTMFGIGMLAKMQEDGDLTEETQGEIDLTGGGRGKTRLFP